MPVSAKLLVLYVCRHCDAFLCVGLLAAVLGRLRTGSQDRPLLGSVTAADAARYFQPPLSSAFSRAVMEDLTATPRPSRAPCASQRPRMVSTGFRTGFSALVSTDRGDVKELPICGSTGGEG